MQKSTVLDIHNTVTASELEKIVNFQLDSIFKNPESVKKFPPLFVHGSPGCGKSSVIAAVCRTRGIEFHDIRLSQLEPCDIKGLPVPNREEKTMDWYVNGMWPRNPDGKGIILLDALSSADRSCQVASYELVLDRRLGKHYSVPPGYLIIAAGNNTTDKAVAVTMSSALANRFMHVELKEDAESWLDWARVNDIHPAVVGFIMARPDMLFKMEGQNLERGWPTPRSWERVSEICHNVSSSQDTLFRKMVYGLVGNGAGVEFTEFYKLNAEFDNILEIMLDPESKITVPAHADRKYAMCSAMVYLLWRGKDKNEDQQRVNGFYRICCELPSDFASMALVAAFKGKDDAEQTYRCNTLFHHPMFKQWSAKHGASLRKYVDVKSLFK